MQVFDASSIIYAWDNYPEGQFPPLWDWLAERFTERSAVMCRVAFDEVKRRSPDCGKWLTAENIEIIEASNQILREALRIKQSVGIIGDNYHPKGVNENDLLIIASALVHGAELVSDERRQTKLPDEPRKVKIPMVCARADVSVPCIGFVEFMKRSGRVFAS